MKYEYDPELSVVRTFEFERPRTGGLDSLVNLGLINFKYSQHATPKQRPESPESVKTTQAWLDYVDNMCKEMNKEISIHNIKKIRMLEGGYFEFVCVEDGQDKIVKDETVYVPNKTPGGPYKHNGTWPHWTHYYRTWYSPNFQNVLKLQHCTNGSVQEYFVPEQYPRGY